MPYSIIDILYPQKHAKGAKEILSACRVITVGYKSETAYNEPSSRGETSSLISKDLQLSPYPITTHRPPRATRKGTFAGEKLE